ncbi:MAG: hypothetical protein ACOH2F_03815 [Cellulomonas sp.]
MPNSTQSSGFCAITAGGPSASRKSRRPLQVLVEPVAALDCDELEPGAEWISGDSFAFQVRGNDLVHVSDIDDLTGEAVIRVFAGTDSSAPVIFSGTVNLRK